MEGLPNARSFTDEQSSWTRNHVVSLQQFSRPALAHVVAAADAARRVRAARGGCALLARRVLANVFLEPSTRTSCSFAAAMLRLGGTVVQVSEATSSVAKGESLADTVRSMTSYADALVLRHPAQGSAAVASRHCAQIPFLNAGDGVGEHPTQALLDLYTVVSEQRRHAAAAGASAPAGVHGLDGLTFVLVGDLKHGRTVHSLARLLALFRVTLVCVSPPELGMPEDVRREVASAGHLAAIEPDAHSLDPAILARADVLYVTRVQKERFASAEQYERLKLAFVVTPETMAHCKPGCILMHPLPRVGEIDEAVDSDPRAAYFRQMECGLDVRMALLALLFGVSRERLEAEASSAEAAAARGEP